MNDTELEHALACALAERDASAAPLVLDTRVLIAAVRSSLPLLISWRRTDEPIPGLGLPIAELDTVLVFKQAFNSAMLLDLLRHRALEGVTLDADPNWRPCHSDAGESDENR